MELATCTTRAERLGAHRHWRHGVRSLLLAPRLLVVLTLLLVYAYTPPRWSDWNQNSRFDLTRAIVDRGTVRIDAYAENTGDYALVDGHIYSDKAPGLSLLAIPPYILTKALGPVGLDVLANRLSTSESFRSTLSPGGQDLSAGRVRVALALAIVTLLTVSLPAVLMLMLLAAMIERLTDNKAIGIVTALIIGLASPVAPYAQAFYGHVPAAACLVGALALLVLNDQRAGRWTLIGVGVLLGLAVVIEYPAALAGIPIAGWAVYRYGRRAIVGGLLGALPMLGILVIYDLLAFGTPLPVGYEHSALWQDQHETGFMSITWPHWDALWGLSFSSFRGLFFFSPILLLAIPGVLLLVRSRTTIALGTVTALGVAFTFLFFASSVMWWGGFAAGPRYLIPAVPLLAIPLGAALARLYGLSQPWRVIGIALAGVLGVASLLMTWSMTVAGQNYPPDTIREPLINYAWPAIWGGDIARNIGMALEIDGLWSLLPLVVVLTIGLGLAVRGLAEAGEAS